MSKIAWFPHPTLVWRPLAKERPSISTYPNLYTAESTLNTRRWQYGFICIRLAFLGSEICKIPRNFERIRGYNRSRSSKIIDLGANQKSICDFLLAVNSNIGRISYRFRDIEYVYSQTTAATTVQCTTSVQQIGQRQTESTNREAQLM